MEDLEDEDEGEEVPSEAVSEQDSIKEHSEAFDYICPPTVKWLLYPDDDDEDEKVSSKSLHLNNNLSLD